MHILRQERQGAGGHGVKMEEADRKNRKRKVEVRSVWGNMFEKMAEGQ